MAKINVLPPQIAELIAAGEVIDRPSSIVKELVENALDAGATRISVEIKGGGIGSIRITDNGCGISREDLPNAFIRHATSKIGSLSDLDAIGTLGFRGEALPSIAAISHVKVTTRTAEDSLGSTFSITGVESGTLGDAGCPVGTTVEVRDVFYNTPARMKFLKKDTVEGNAIASLLDRLALANPNVAFEFIREGKRVLQTPGDGKLISAIRVVCGGEVAAQMIPVSHRENGITVEGYISKPATCRSTRTLQIFFINTRYIHSRTCTAAVEDAYKNRMMVGRFPACVLNLTIDTSLVDVNVHPAKLEVRFSSERDVYNAVSTACETALQEQERRPIAEKKRLTLFSLDDFDYSDQQTRLAANQPGSGAAPAQKAQPQGAASGFTSQNRQQSSPSPTPVSRAASCDAPRSDSTWDLFPKKSAATLAAPKEQDILAAVTPTSGKEEPRTAVPAAPVRTYANIDIEATKRPERIPPLEQAEPVSGESISELRTAVPAAPVRAYANIDIEATKRPERIPPPPDEPVCAPEQPGWTILGELFDTYILVQQGDLFHLIDKHAAHERFQYNRLRHIGEEPADRQVLLTPEAITLPREEAFALLEHPEALAAVGITVDDLGEGTLVVREIPMILTDCPLRDVLSEIAGKLIANRRGLTPSFIDELLYSVACRSAVMAGRKSSMPELRVLAELVLGEENIRFCPHGRPALVTLKKREIEKMFGRLG